MKKYQFETSATMKEYNHKQWWIDSNIVRKITVEAENLTDAIYQYRELVASKYYVDISRNALRTKQPMYIDTPSGAVQCGYVITGSTEFVKDSGELVLQYIDLWVTIYVIQYPFNED